MKILYISDSSIPSFSANSVHVMKMCNAFANNGHETYLLSKNTRACLPNVTDVFKFYGVDKGFTWKKWPDFSFSGSGRYYNLFIPYFSFGKYDLVYTRSIYASFWYSLFKKQFVFEVHEPFSQKGKFLKSLFNFIIKKKQFQKIVVISEALKAYLLSNYEVDLDQIIVAPDGADPINDSIIPEKFTEKRTIGYVGSLLIGKGIELIVPLSKKLPHLNFHIVGGNESQIQYWKDKAPKASNLIFHGSIPHSQTAKYIKSFDILLAPYQDKVFVKSETNSNNIAKWMSPLKIFEYMAAEKPIISSDLPVIKEVLRNDENAVLCKSDDLNEWKEGIQKLMLDRELSYRIASKAKKDFDNLYTWNKRAARILKKIFS